MKLLEKTAFEQIRAWMYKNARPLDIARWRYHFENGAAEDVLFALSFYQNADGGFGGALEPDCWNPESTPYTTFCAAKLLEGSVGVDTNREIEKGILRYLESRAHTDENGWLFSVPSNNEHPHAPWWTFCPKSNAFENVGLSAELAAFSLKYAKNSPKLYAFALETAKKLARGLNEDERLGEMAASGYISLCGALKTVPEASGLNIDAMSEKIAGIVNASIERDVAKWKYHCKTPRDFIDSPASEYYAANRELTETELDYIIDSREQNGVWNITWSWFDNNEKYAREFAISENWWKADLAIATLLHLSRFGRVAGSR